MPFGLPLLLSTEARILLGDSLGCVYDSKNAASTAQLLKDLTQYFAELPYKRGTGSASRGKCARTFAEAWPAMLQQIPKMTEEVHCTLVSRYVQRYLLFVVRHRKIVVQRRQFLMLNL